MNQLSLKEKFRNIIPIKIWKQLQVAKKNLLKIKYRTWGRSYIPGETSKAKKRREDEDFFRKYCNGKGLDIGFGGDPVTPNVEGFDFEHGDAQFLKGIENESYDFVYSSHTLEHVFDVETTLKNWFRVLKPGGYLILLIPHRDLYEKKKNLPSIFNPTHQRFFLIGKDELPDTVGIIPLLNRTLTDFDLIYCKECSEGHTITSPLIHSDGEYSIEIVLKKNVNS